MLSKQSVYGGKKAEAVGDFLGETPRFKLDATTSRIMTEVAERHGLSVGYLRRFVDEEGRLSHLGRRHGIFDNLLDLVRHERDRRLAQSSSSSEEAL